MIYIYMYIYTYIYITLKWAHLWQVSLLWMYFICSKPVSYVMEVKHSCEQNMSYDDKYVVLPFPIDAILTLSKDNHQCRNGFVIMRYVVDLCTWDVMHAIFLSSVMSTIHSTLSAFLWEMCISGRPWPSNLRHIPLVNQQGYIDLWQR